MFHDFRVNNFAEGARSQDDGGDVLDRTATSTRKTSTIRACEHCRKRKIRCDGGRPCEACRHYHTTKECCYTEPRQRQLSNRRSMDQIASTLRDYRKILRRVFPNHRPDSLVNLPREKLLELISQSASTQPPSPPLSNGGVVEINSISPNAEADGLETLQTMPEETADIVEDPQIKGIEDEVNALSLSVKVASSYQGISSVMAVFRVILWIYPESQTFFSASPDRTTTPSGVQTPSAKESIVTKGDDSSCLDGYFQFVHPLIPLIEEQSFRDTYHRGNRQDSRWLALLNMVLAMGSVAATNADNEHHLIYFEQAKQHLGGLECLGSAHLETVQTLAIMGGFYLHYLQSPNDANSIMGACFRMAMALGLHREYMDNRPRTSTINPACSADMRRRVWWSIYVLDAWANMPLGRPSLRDSAAITADSPLLTNDRSQGIAMLFLTQNIKFVKITTQIEDALAITPLVPNSEMCALDAALVDWYTQFSGTIHATEIMGNSEGSLSARVIMGWRYQISRIILYRPVLLNYAMRRIPSSQLKQHEQDAIQKCRDIARGLIKDIATGCRPNQMCGWNGLWFIYNAVLVPLLSLFSDPHDPGNVDQSRTSVELALQTMNKIKQYSPTGQRSIEVTSRVYEASKRLIADTRSIIEKNAAASKKVTKASRDIDRHNITANKSKNTPTPLRFSSSGIASLLTPPLQEQPSSTSSTDFFTDFQQPSPDSTSSFHAYNPTNLPTGSNGPNLDIQTMWDSLNWTTGYESLDFPFDNYPLTGLGWPEDVGPPSFEASLNTHGGIAASMDGLTTTANGGYWGPFTGVAVGESGEGSQQDGDVHHISQPWP